jgi:hypothetical protein
MGHQRSMRQHFTSLRSTTLFVLTLITTALLASACGSSETPETFSVELRSDFLTACTDSLSDPEIVTEVCKCVFDKSQRELSISVFASYEATLKNDPTADMPEPLKDMMARCVLEESSLGG